MLWRMKIMVGWVALLIAFSSPTHAKINFSAPSSNPYEVLGISHSSTLEQIKRRYRTLAKKHHPDKGGNPEMFARIASAYEVLSDKERRRQFDRQQQFQRTWNQQQQQRNEQKRAEQQKQQAKEREAKERQKARKNHANLMQRHLLRLHTIEDLFVHGILNKDYIFQKNFLGVFVGNKNEEKIVDDKFLFPFPFWGSARNGMKWQDVIQTAKIRYNKVTGLTTFFDVPLGARTAMPYIVFVRAGHSVKDMRVFSARHLQDAQEQLEAWVTNHLAMRVTFINRHHSAVNLFLVVDQALSTQQPPVLLHTLKSGQAIPLALHLGDKIVAVDARVDAYPGSSPFDATFFQGYPSDKFNKSPNPESWYFKNPAILGEYLIGLTTTLEIEEEHCFDLSLKCQSWTLQFGATTRMKQQHPKCQEQPEFMHHICPASCGICQRKANLWFETLRYPLQQAPIHLWPHVFRPVIKFSRSMVDDLVHVMAWRRTIAFIFLTTGVILGLNMFVLPCCLLGGRFKCFASAVPKFSLLERSSLTLFVSTIMFWVWIQFGASPSHSSLRRDWDHMLVWQLDALFGLVVLGMACVAIVKITVSAVWKQRGSMTLRRKLTHSFAILTIFAISTIVMVLLSLVFDPTTSRVRRWQHLWKFRKNLSSALVCTGVVIGMALPTLWKGIRKYPELVMVTLMDVGLLLALDWISLKDIHFMEDLNHVLQLRMSAAIPIGILGIFLGIGGPFTIMISFPVQSKATLPSVPTKSKSD